MKPLEIAQVLALFVVVLTAAPLLGSYMARVYSGGRNFLSPVLGRVEHAIYRFGGVDPQIEMRWTTYAAALLAFNLVGLLLLWLLQLAQASLPLNPARLPNVGLWLAFNTAVSFVTNTNWQSYSGETTMSYLVQMAGLTIQNFVSAATGMAVAIALARGLARKSSSTIGNFWSDLVRGTLYILLPLSVILAFLLVSQGVVQTFSPPATALTLQGSPQVIPLGPAASQVAIKQLGSNGGGFFNANSAHPLENPTPFSNFLELVSILLIPAGLPFTYGSMVGSHRQGWAIFAAMATLFTVFLAGALASEFGMHPANLEGKEVRFGVANSVLWAVTTTAVSNGSVNSMHSSLSPLAGMLAMLNMQLGEVAFGGVGAGLYGMLMFVILTVFVAGLMVGRTPEYLGKKIEAFEIKMAVVAVLSPSAFILLFSPLAAVTKVGLASVLNPGPHGLSEILYAFSSAAANNGSAFAGLNANTDFYNILLGIAMLVGRYAVIVPALAIAGSMVVKQVTPPSSGTFPTDGLLFVALLVSVVVIIGALTFFPSLTLGPIVEHFLMRMGRTF
ncbi:MAG: potassium-transporting ATPase subunit KdpA [Chloroflexi bacterium]|nr:potassium-transporting ATPase subunit KdpA [Chloroflexota bacterium]